MLGDQTRWHNPTKLPVVFQIFTTGNRREEVKIPPDVSVDLPAEYDRAVQRVKSGVVQGGLAPQLRRLGTVRGGKLIEEKDPPPVHPSLAATDPSAQSPAVLELAAKVEDLHAQMADLVGAFKATNEKAKAAEALLEEQSKVVTAKDAEIKKLRDQLTAEVPAERKPRGG